MKKRNQILTPRLWNAAYVYYSAKLDYFAYHNLTKGVRYRDLSYLPEAIRTFQL